MSETRACAECRGAGWVPTQDASDHTGYGPCRDCHGTGKVWSPDILRDGEPWTHEVPPGPGASRTVHFHAAGDTCGACPDTLETCSAPVLKDEPPW